LSSVLCPLSSVLCPLSSVLCPLSSVLCPLSSLSSVLCPLSSVLCPLSSVLCHPRSTCQYSCSTGVARPKIVTDTRNLPRSSSISSTMPFWFWNGPSATLTVSPTSKLTFGFTFSSRSFICASMLSTSD